MTSKAKTNPFTFRCTWKPFTEQDITWVQRFFALLPPNPELKHWKNMTATELHLCDSGEGQYNPHTDEFEYHTNDMMTVGAYTITKTITTDIIERVNATTRRERFSYVVHETVHQPSSSRWEPDDFDVAELGEAPALADALKMIFLREYEFLFEMVAEAVSIEYVQKEQADFHAECV